MEIILFLEVSQLQMVAVVAVAIFLLVKMEEMAVLAVAVELTTLEQLVKVVLELLVRVMMVA